MGWRKHERMDIQKQMEEDAKEKLMPRPGCPKCNNEDYTVDKPCAEKIKKYPVKEKHIFTIAGELFVAHFRYVKVPKNKEESSHPWGRGRLPCFCPICKSDWDWETSEWWTW